MEEKTGEKKDEVPPASSFSDSPLAAVLRGIFGPLLDVTKTWPPLLAYGAVFAVLVVVVALLNITLPKELFWLLTVIFVLVLVAYVFTLWNERRQQEPGRRPEPPPEPGEGITPAHEIFGPSDVLLDLSHNQTGSHNLKGWDPLPSINVGYLRIKGIAIGMGWNVEERDTTGLLTGDFGKPGVLIFVCPKHVDLTTDERRNVGTYVRSGGCLLALGFYCEPHHKTNFSSLMKSFGFGFNPDLLLPPGSKSADGHWQAYQIRPQCIVRANTDVMPTPDPLLEGVKTIGLLSASSLEITKPKDVRVVLHSGQEQLIWKPNPEGIELDANGYWDKITEWDPSQEKERPIVAKAMVDRGKVVAIGTWKVFHDYFIDNPEFDNGRLFRNILSWFKE